MEGMKAGRNLRPVLGALLTGVILALVVEGFLAWRVSRCGWKDPDRIVGYVIEEMENCEGSGGSFYTWGGDVARISLHGPQPIGSVRLRYGAPLSEDETVVLYYAPEQNEGFHRLRVVEGYLMQGTDQAVIPLPPGPWTRVRLDIEGEHPLTAELYTAWQGNEVSDLMSVMLRNVVPWRLAAMILLAFLGAWGLSDKGSNGQTRPRDPSMDALRVLAAVLVVVLHVITPIRIMTVMGERRQMLACVIQSFSSCCNCLFLLISGALLLPWREESLGTYMKKRFLRVLLPLAVYTLLYSRLCCLSVASPGQWLAQWLPRLLSRRIQMAPHLGLAYEIVGAYLVVIPFRYMLKAMPEKAEKGLAALILLCLSARTLLACFGLEMGITSFLDQWIGVMLLGYLLTRDWMRPWDGRLLGAGVAALAAASWLTATREDAEMIISNQSIWMVLLSSGIFVLLRRWRRGFRPLARPLAFLGQYSFPVLLIHWFVLYRVLYNGVFSPNTGDTSFFLGQVGLCLAISIGLALLIERLILAALENGSFLKIRLPALLLAAALLLAGCGAKEKKLEAYDAQYLDYFDTITSITIYAESEEQFDKYEEAFRSEMERYHRLFDIYNSYSGLNNVKTVNDNAGISPVQVDPELIRLLELSVKEWEETDGRVNVAMGSVLSLWHQYREEGLADPERAQLPDPSQLRRAAEHVDITQMVLDKEKSTVYLPDSAMSLDVGAVAKGYAANRICEKLREMGVTSALISIGGNVQTIGVRGDGKPWRVGVQNPDISSPNSYLHVMDLSDMALVTSGVYQRFYEVDGVRYHHIIHPDSLMPWQKYASVTILCPDGGRADALSTAVFNMEPEVGQAFVESQEGVEALWILPDGEEIFSSGFRDYMEE